VSQRLVALPDCPAMTAITTPAGITIEYDTFGSPSDPALLLVMGFTAQMISWRPGYCQRLADGGRFVIRFDNRDSGLSTKFDGQLPDLAAVMAAAAAGDIDAVRAAAPYTLSDMADDAFELLTALGIEQAHIAGASMGGMIVQTMAIEHPERVLSMTSIMSRTGEPGFGEAEPESIAALLTPSPPEREAFIDASKKALLWQSKRYGTEALCCERAAESFDRSFYPEGALRQFAAIAASGSREDGLRSLTVPTLVIHGRDDTLITPSGGERTASVIPDAKLLMFDDMGHDQPEPLWPELCDAILAHTS
jgi:pimeloyl-ACP methyl ester carboxylesterase